MPATKSLALMGVALVVTGVAVARGQVATSAPPISGDTVTLRLTIGGEPAQIGVQNGSLARLTLKDGPTIGLRPVIRGESIDLVLLEVTVDPATGNEDARQLGSERHLEKGRVERFDLSGLALDAELVAINSGQMPTSAPAGPCRTCCVNCGAITMCACWVILDCGSCCCDTACKCWEGVDAGGQAPKAPSGCDPSVNATGPSRRK